MNEEYKITFDDLADWLDKPLSNNDIDLINFILTCIENRYKCIELQQKINQQNRTLEVVEALLKKHIQDINQKIDFEIDMGSQGDYHKIKNFEITIRILKEILNELGGFNE